MAERFRGFWRGAPRTLGARVEDAAAFLQSVLTLYLAPDWRVRIDDPTAGRLWIESAGTHPPLAYYRLQVTADCRRLQFGHGREDHAEGLDALFRPLQEIDVVDLDRQGLARCITRLMELHPPERLDVRDHSSIGESAG